MATLKEKTISSTPPLSQLHSTLSSLQTATYILAGLTHRNKNQHRGTKWWPAFNMLRRSLQKLMLDLEAAIQRADVVVVPSAKKRKATAKHPELDRVIERAGWMSAVLGPRAYEAFTQLTADRQFAQLGLVLIGVLAQVEAALAPFVPAEPPQPRIEDISGPLGVSQGGVVVAGPEAGSDAADLDLGIAVSRDELEDETHAQASIEPIPSSIPSLHSMREQDDPERTKSKKRKQPRSDIQEPRTQITETSFKTSKAAEKRRKLQLGEHKPRAAGPDTVTEEPKEPKKSTKPKLDENSLGTTENEPKSKTRTLDDTIAVKKSKKKKKKGGDEFDDLFSSLL